MKKMAFVATSYIKKYDGVSVYTENLLKELLLLIEKEYKNVSIDIFAGESVLELLKSRVSSNINTLNKNITFIPINDQSFILKTMYLTKALLFGKRYTLIFMVNYMPIFFTSGKRLKVIHDLSIEHFPKLAPWHTRLYIYILHQISKYLDYGIGCISNTTKKDLQYFHKVNEANKKLLYLPNGIPFKVKKYPRPENEIILKKYEGKQLDFLVVGRINRAKGIDRIIKFCTFFDNYLINHDTFKEVNLHLAGKQTQETEILFKNAHFKNMNLIFHGFIDDEALNDLYKLSHFCFFLSRNEGYGLPLIETIWFKSIPILSDISIFNEIMTERYPKFDNETGYEEEIKDFILTIFQKKEYLQSILSHIEMVVKKEKDGYKTAAANLLDFFESMK